MRLLSHLKKQNDETGTQPTSMAPKPKKTRICTHAKRYDAQSLHGQKCKVCTLSLSVCTQLFCPANGLWDLFLENKLKSDKNKYQGNAVKFISNQLAEFGLVLSENKNWSQIVLQGKRWT